MRRLSVMQSEKFNPNIPIRQDLRPNLANGAAPRCTNKSQNCRVPVRKRKLLLVALMSISAGGCASSEKWRPSFVKSNGNEQTIPSGSESVSWEEVLATVCPPSTTPRRDRASRDSASRNGEHDPICWLQRDHGPGRDNSLGMPQRTSRRRLRAFKSPPKCQTPSSLSLPSPWITL